LQHLVDAGYRAQPQWPAGAYRIDIAVEGQHRRLAVECDGERVHTPEHLQRDMERQAILECVGWVFTRIRGSHFFCDPDTAMAPVFTKLNDLGIEPLGPVRSQPTTPDAEQRAQRVRRRAQAL
jgi:very-short-patch-repair endonuclease